MKKSNIFLFHSLNGDTLKMWGKDVKAKFENQTEVIMPEFPIRAESSYQKFEAIVFEYLKNKTLNENSIVVCHSIGNAYFIRFSAKHGFKPKAYISVAPGAIYEYPETRTDYIVEVKKQAYLKREEFDYVKKNFENIVCFYSDEDDNNLEKFERFVEDTGAEGFYLKGYNHFDGYHEVHEVPEVIAKLNEFLNK